MTDAAVQTPATDTVAPTEMTEDQALDAAWDAINADNTDDTDAEEQAPEEDAADAETADEPEAEADEEASTDVPSDIPGHLKAVWGQLDEEAREALLTGHREMARKVSDAARKSQAFEPIMGAVQEIAKMDAAVANMRPEELRDQLVGLYRAGQNIQRNPAQALRALAEHHKVNLADLAGKGQPTEANQLIQQLHTEISGLKQQLSQQSDPNALRQNFRQWQTEDQVISEVENFAKSQEHWGDVEDKLILTIPLAQAKLGDQAAPKDVLQSAYEMAIEQFAPHARAKKESAGVEPAPTDPERARKVLRAKSVNVTGKKSSGSTPKSEDEIMDEVWDRLHAG